MTYDEVMADMEKEWQALITEMESIIVESDEPFDPDTILNARDFMVFANKSLQLPLGLNRGYWPTICIYWSTPQPPNIMVEVHEDHYEYYGSYDGRTDIRHYDHSPDEPMPEEFAALLPQN